MIKQSILDVHVSYFRNYTSVDPVTVNLLDILTTKKHKDRVEVIRSIKDKTERDRLKAKLPAFTPSGVFSRRADNALLQHTGLLQLDIDPKENMHIANYADLKCQFSKIAEVAYCGLSVSGTGFYCLVPVMYPEKHREHFRVLQNIFASKGLNIDGSCINVSSLRGVSYDTEPYFNHQAKAFMLYDEPKKEVPSFTRSYNTTMDAVRRNINSLISTIERKRVDLTTTYKEWFELSCSIANCFGEEGREYFHRLSQFHPEYSPSRADLQYDKSMKKPYNFSIGTLFYHCRQAGIGF